MHILLVEYDNIEGNTSLLANLEEGGHDVCLAHTPETAAQKTLLIWPNLVVLNPAHSLNLDDVKAALDETKLDVPWVVVGSKDQNYASAAGNNVIVFDPGQPQALDHQIEQVAVKHKDRFVRLPSLTIDLKKRCVLRNKEKFPLTPKEFKLLRLFLDHENQILKRKTIMQKVWETDYMGDTRTLDVHIRWLRQKIEDNPGKPKCLITIRGVGYRFSTDCE